MISCLKEPYSAVHDLCIYKTILPYHYIMHSVCLPSPPCVLVQQLTGSAQGGEIACCMLTSFWITRKVVLFLFLQRKELAIVARPRTPKLLVARRSAKARERSPEHLHLDRRQSRLQGLWVEDWLEHVQQHATTYAYYSDTEEL